MAEAFLRIERVTKGRVEGQELWQQIPLGPDRVLIARPGTEADALAPDIRIVGDDYVSRKPVEIAYSPGEKCYVIKDWGTTNGTFLNDEQLESDGRPYVLKDFDLIGLARVQGDMRVLLRFRLSQHTQAASTPEEPVRSKSQKGLAVNIPARRVFVDGREVSLTKTEWKVFECLYRNRGKVCTMDDLTWEVWGDEAAAPELVAKYIQRLRDKIEPERARPRYIIFNPAGGYTLHP